MVKGHISRTIEGINESIYAGFWLRLGSLAIDFLILLPFIFLIHFINSLSLKANYITNIASLILHFWFSIYLVKKYGGTPGKLLLNIKILKLSGENVTWREAFLRQLIPFVLGIHVASITMIALSWADPSYYERLGWKEKSSYLNSLAPVLFQLYLWPNAIFACSEFIVLLLNKRRRALHDFIANTIVIKTKYALDLKEQSLH